MRGHVLDRSGAGPRIFARSRGWSEAKSAAMSQVDGRSPGCASFQAGYDSILGVYFTAQKRLGRERMCDQALQPIAPAEVSSGSSLAKALLALNNAHALELSWLEPARLQHLVSQAFLARRIGNFDAFLLAFDQGADYDSPNFLWFRARYPRFVYVDRSWSPQRRAVSAVHAGFIGICSNTPKGPAMSTWSVRSTSARRTRRRMPSMPRSDLSRSAPRASMGEARRCGICCARCQCRPRSEHFTGGGPQLNAPEGVIRGLDPRIHQSSEKAFSHADGLPGIGERKRRRPSDGYARQ